MNRINFFTYVAILCTFFACGPKCETYEISETVKTYGLFQPGTWWLIQNDSTLFRDTIKVMNVEHGFHEGCAGCGTCDKYEYYTVIAEGDSLFSGGMALGNAIGGCSQNLNLKQP